MSGRESTFLAYGLPTGLPENAAILPGANRLTDPARGWYFSVMVRAAWARLAQQHATTPAE
ncbi:MAG TPA: hypothetical protein VNZ52_14740 [Candidatus Thermoplasmatota archaeon]|nr:hypothetical protein [Candidatus Thermoplasmatota archaeon]